MRRLSFFGSVLGPDFGPASDIDILVEFEPGHEPGLAFVELQWELEVLFGERRVDLVTPGFLHERIRADVMRDAHLAYAA